MKKLYDFYTRFNETVAATATRYMGTMEMVYLLAILSVLPFFLPNYKDLIAYISSGVVQLVALPLIMVGQAVLSRSSEDRAQQDHETLLHSHMEIDEQIRMLRALVESERSQNSAIEELTTIIETQTCRSCPAKPDGET